MTFSEKSKRKQRRPLSRSDEEIEIEMDKKGLSYRFGWPDLLPPPLVTITAHTRLEDEEKHLNTVKKILQDSSVHVQEVFFADRAPRWASAKTQGMFLTLVVSLDTVLNSRFGMHNAVKKIRHYFKTPGTETQELPIEFIDFRAMDDLISIPLGPQDNHIVNQWPDFLNKLITELKKLQQHWRAIELCYRGLFDNRQHNTLTVVITTDLVDEDKWWKEVLPTLRSSMNPPFELQYEMIYSGTLEMAMRNDNGRHISNDSYGEQLAMGSSIGISTLGNHAGTAGGVVTLGDKGPFALTNFHVVANGRIDASES